MAEVTNIEWAVGDYVKHRGGLARIAGLRNPTSLELVAYYDQGVGITCGGHVLLGGDHVAELEPVTDARDFLIVEGYAAALALKEAKEVIDAQQHTVEVCTAALKALDGARGAALAKQPGVTA